MEREGKAELAVESQGVGDERAVGCQLRNAKVCGSGGVGPPKNFGAQMIPSRTPDAGCRGAGFIVVLLEFSLALACSFLAVSPFFPFGILFCATVYCNM